MSPNDRVEGDEFPRFGWRIDRRHLLQNQEEQEGNGASKQGAEQQDDPEGNNAPANYEVAEESAHNKEQGGEAAPANNAHADNEAEDVPRAACASPSTLSTDSALLPRDWI